MWARGSTGCEGLKLLRLLRLWCSSLGFGGFVDVDFALAAGSFAVVVGVVVVVVVVSTFELYIYV